MKNHLVNRPVFYTSESRLPQGTKKIDALPGALEELFLIEHPKLRMHLPGVPAQAQAFAKKYRKTPVWAYFPWKKTAVRIPDERTYYSLRTARNRNLITQKEQGAYRNTRVGIAGLSVGSAILEALVRTGGPKALKLADPDTVEITNLNRMKADITNLHTPKALVASHAAWEIDPFLDMELWDKGINPDSLGMFLGTPTLDIFIDEMDDIRMKFFVREECRRRRIPVLMATDNGEGALLDVERFDHEPRRPIFHGRVSVRSQELTELDRKAFAAIAEKIIDTKLMAPRQLSSLRLMGKKLAGVAQLGTAASAAGVLTAYAVRRIATGQKLPSGRYVLSPESILG